MVVVEQENHRVQVFSAQQGRSLFAFGQLGSGSSEFRRPAGVAIDHQGRIVIVDQDNHRVQVFSAVREFLFEFGQRGSAQGQLLRPAAAATSRLGRIYVADTNNHRVQVFSASDGSFLFEFGGSSGKFDRPSGVAIDDELGRVYVADTNNHRVQVFAVPDGRFLFEFGEYGSGAQHFSFPYALTLYRRWYLLVSDLRNMRITACTLDGEFVSHYTVSALVHGLACDNHGRILMSLTSHHHVRVLPPCSWLPDEWRPHLHADTPVHVARVVRITTMIRSLEPWTPLALLPNQLLFQVFAFL